MNYRTILRRSALLALAAALAPATALAHPGHEASGHLMAGLLHPLTGLDHVLMIIAVSAWAATLAPAGRVAVVSSLALFVGAGALVPVSGGLALETAIALTVIGAGTLLAMGRRWPLWTMASLGAVFALVHGMAHGAEGEARDFAYITGLMLATGAMASCALLVSMQLQSRALWLRVAGAASAVTGAAVYATGG